jgi:hypothetical protein
MCDSDLETGDVILFSTNKWYSDVIEYANGSIFSHCGIILRDPFYIDPNLSGLYMLESGAESIPDVVDNKFHFGVQIVPLDKIIKEYSENKEGEIYIRKLKCKRDKKFEETLCEIYNTIKNKPYNYNPMDWIEALLGFSFFDKQITTRFWCSALVAFVFVKLGLIQPTIEWSLVTPRDWSSGSESQFIFSGGTSLEKEIKIL